MTKEKTILDQLENALDEIRPHLKVDGGDIEIVELTDDMILKIKWLGNCEGCNMSFMTLKAGVEQVVKDKVPSIKSIVAING